MFILYLSFMTIGESFQLRNSIVSLPRQTRVQVAKTIDEEPPPSFKPRRVAIHYSDEGGHVLRGSWLALEVLLGIEKGIESMTLVPVYDSDEVFKVFVDDVEIFDAKSSGQFPNPNYVREYILDKLQHEALSTPLE